ncbi:DNA mismatch repair protein [Halospeciosus flavus]|uniref:DNA mismatch repair protein n=1 Tax=Halospeciosus flavus TaxID=3032283 RepID=A0ABD5Z5K3_9EURY|nr:DNA mismatch repair protein [Halospeciosus flavus]
MDLQDYWGVGPKTADLLASTLGTDAAVDAIESADVRALVDAGLPRGRATRILRRANGDGGLDLLATDDTRDVYKSVLSVARDYALTEHAADRVQVLTPLHDADAIEDRLDRVVAARETWERLSDDERAAVEATFADHDGRDDEGSAVETALALVDQGRTEGPFAPLADLDADALADAADALRFLDQTGDEPSVREGADDDLDRLRDARDGVERHERRSGEVVDAVKESGARDPREFREALVEYVTDETAVGPGRVREHTADDARDAADFVSGSLRNLADALREAVATREEAVAADLREDIDEARADVDAAVAAVSDIAFFLSLARFAAAFDLTRPEVVTDRDALAVEGARNLALETADGGSVAPVTYGLGDHGATGPPSGDRVSVLTGANSGGKTTLLETLCQTALLTHLGLPVPAERAEVSPVDAVVFHRRHASFNAGVLETTLRSVVPPLADDGRTLMLVDEFEAITEPGRAADLLHGLVTLTADRGDLGVYVTHLADDVDPLPEVARTDGIFAEGLDAELDLEVDYQPRFGVVGKSTPEFIVSRLVADADDRDERAAFETLAESVGKDVVERTLADAETGREE